MPVKIIVTVEDNGGISIGTTEPVPPAMLVGVLAIAQALVTRPITEPQKMIQTAPAGALKALPKVNGGPAPN